MVLLHNNPKYLLSYDRNFVIIKDNEEKSTEAYYIIYNSVNHIVAKLSKIEFYLLDLLYKYEDPMYISSMLDEKYRSAVRDLLTKDSVSKLICTNAFEEPIFKEQKEIIPSTYYLHLTDRCNLQCTYCYNQKQRSNKEDFHFEKWKEILNKILPHASHIILTGGECFLYPEIGKIIQYIKDSRYKIYLSCISNGMHDYSEFSPAVKFEYIDSIMFSCDSLYRAGNRVGFNPCVFLKSINFFIDNYPNVSLEISATRTIDNNEDLEKIRDFCNSKNIRYKFVNLVPEKIGDIKDMPAAISCFSQCFNQGKSNSYQWPAKNTRCGAGLGVLSINSNGDAYPCQALHYKEFLMGNILQMDVRELKYINNQTMCLPSVDEIEGCKSCNLRYLCGGGCLAVSYPSNGFKFKRNRLICPFNYENAMRKLMRVEKIKKHEV